MSTLKRSRCNSRAFDVQRFAGRHICYVIIQTMRATFTVHLKLQPECWGKEGHATTSKLSIVCAGTPTDWHELPVLISAW